MSRHEDQPPQARVADMDRSLEFYLRLGCDVCSAADGWVLLTSGPTTFVLIPGTDPDPGAAGPWVRLSAPDVRALRRRLLAEGVPVGRAGPTAAVTAVQIEVTDPDGHRVAVAETPPPGRRSGHATRRPPAPSAPQPVR